MDQGNQSHAVAAWHRPPQSLAVGRPLAAQSAEHGQDVDQYSAKRSQAQRPPTSPTTHDLGGGSASHGRKPGVTSPPAANERGMAAVGIVPCERGEQFPQPIPETADVPRRRQSNRGDSRVVTKSVNPRSILALLEAQRFQCALTGRPLTPEVASMDHVVPICRGGEHRIENVQVLDQSVNRAKGTLTNEEFISLCGEVWNHKHQQENHHAD